MLEIGAWLHKAKRKVRLNLFRDRCPCDALILETFNVVKYDPMFRYRETFTSLKPMSWEDCTPLQPADLCAYEAFKEACRLTASPNRNRRKSLETLLKIGKFGTKAKIITDDNLVETVNIMKSHGKLSL